MSFTRRDFLKGASLVALAPTVPAFLARTARAAVPDMGGRVLVVIQLDGGNDGINTVVPFADEGYAKCRKALRLPREQLVKVNDGVGLNPAMGDAGRLLENGHLAILQAVGYPNPNRSHFESMAVWHTARFDPEERNGLGWIGRGLDGDRPPAGGVPGAVFVGGGQMPVALRGRRSVASGLTRPEDFVLAPEAKMVPAGVAAEPKDDLLAFVRRSAVDGYATADRMAGVVRAADRDSRYPATELGKQMELMARLIKGGIGTRVYYARQPGYDTHAAQLGPHAALLRELSGALKAFLDDLTAAKLAERVTVLCFSEFGRTIRENGSAGTDHGTAGPLFLAGPGVKAGLIGAMPKLLDPDPKHGDLRVGLDFRRIYAAVLHDWLGLPAKAALGADFEALALFRA
ncbi:MAG TPA: DUF1501 domain-containing protein [Gemmataceae bacterium]|nr:DUF1501 domain-containing protein [Gemmataceae bacterium]